MSDEDRYRMIGKLVCDHEQAKKDLAALRAKASNLATLLHGVCAALVGGTEWQASGSSFSYKLSSGGAASSGTLPTPGEIVDLLKAVTAAESSVKELEQERKELGV